MQFIPYSPQVYLHWAYICVGANEIANRYFQGLTLLTSQSHQLFLGSLLSLVFSLGRLRSTRHAVMEQKGMYSYIR